VTRPTLREKVGRLLLVLVASLALAGCEQAAPDRPRAPHPLEAAMQSATFTLPTSRYPLPYRLFVPRPVQGRVPLIVWLHSTEGRGDDNLRQLGPELQVLVADRAQRAGPAFVLAPQCPAWDKWANRDATFPLRPYDLSAAPESDAARSTVALVGALVRTYPIDPARVYVMGFSMGGTGTWDMLMRHPEIFAAGVPIAGVADLGRAGLLKSTPAWSFHGELDSTSPVQNGRMMSAALQRVGAPARYTEFKGMGHGSVGEALEEPELFGWLFAQHR
jgi:predicted peptidase